MPGITFETATITDVIKKASKIAPTKGPAFDKAAGILMEVRPNDPEAQVTVKATNTDIFYLEWTNSLAVEGDEDWVWRIPSQLLAQILSSFPMGQNSSVELKQVQGRLQIVCGKTRATISLMDPGYFPQFDPFDPSGLQEVKGLAARMTQVAWAADKSTVPMNGIYLDGSTAVATNRYRLARVPLEAPFSEPVTLPQDVIAPLMKETVDAMVGVFNGKFYMMPDDDTQIVANVYAAKFPDVKRALNPQRPAFVEVLKDQLADSINRMMLLVASDRYPRLDITFGDERIHIALRAEGTGLIEDQIDVDGQAVHEDFTNYFDPKNMLDAIRNCPNSKLKIGYDASNARVPFYIDGGSGYEAWVVPRAKTAPGAAQGESK